MKKVQRPPSVAFVSPLEKEQKVYEDTLPEDLPTLEEVRQKYGKVVWCKYVECKDNEAIKGLQRTSGKLLKNKGYVPLNEQEHIWANICTREEIGISFDTVITASGYKIKVPSCFTAVSGVSGRKDWSSLLQGDGSPFGGNIESQNTVNNGYY